MFFHLHWFLEPPKKIPMIRSVQRALIQKIPQIEMRPLLKGCGEIGIWNVFLPISQFASTILSFVTVMNTFTVSWQAKYNSLIDLISSTLRLCRVALRMDGSITGRNLELVLVTRIIFRVWKVPFTRVSMSETSLLVWITCVIRINNQLYKLEWQLIWSQIKNESFIIHL